MHARWRAGIIMLAVGIAVVLAGSPAVAADAGPTDGSTAAPATPAPVTTPDANRCDGRLLDSVPVVFAGETVGTLNVYYGAGFNCATVTLRRGTAAAVAEEATALSPNPPVSSPDPVPPATDLPTAPAGVAPDPTSPSPASPSPASSPQFLMYVALQRCEAIRPGPLCRDVETVQDSGPYSRLAGPVRVYAPSQCIRAEGRVQLAPGLEAYAETRPGATFCG